MSQLIYINFFLGVFVIILGLLVYRFPNLISGVSSIRREALKSLDLQGLKRELRLIFIITGLCYWILAFLEYIHISTGIWGIIVVSIISSILLSFRSMHYYKSPRKNKEIIVSLLSMVIIFAVIFILMGQMEKPNTITMNTQIVTIDGRYGREIPLDSIESIEWLDTIPGIGRRTNGYDSGKVLKGHFRLRNGEKAMLYIQNRNIPLIEIKTTTNQWYYLNRPTISETLKLYDNLMLLYKQ